MKPSSKTQKRKIYEGAEVLEEVLWLLSSKKGSGLKNLPTLLRDLYQDDTELNSVAKEYVSPNPNKHFLIGVLPRLFQDTRLFPKNEDIADFANSVLQVNIPRFEKRSKYELIGLIVCQTNELNETRLATLVEALTEITAGGDEKLKLVAEARQKGHLNWNDAIRRIAQFRDE